MPNLIQVKRSAVSAKVPTTTDLALGEIAVNTFDGKMYIKKDNGTASIVEIGAGGSGTVTSVSALTLGTTGTNLSSTVTNSTTTPVITLNVPTASASNRGALSSTDWSTFNGKQAALVSGTNIKTVNSTTLLGSGNLAVGTVTSVSGTGTVAGLTLTGTVTGSGNLTLGGNLSITADMIYDTFTATASQTTFTTSQTYTSGKIQVFVNGVKFRNGSDVTVTSGTSVVMATGLTAGDLVDLVYPT